PAGSVLQADRFTVQLNPDAVTTDVVAFESAWRSAQRAQSDSECERFLADAIALYRGELLSGYYEGWITPEQLRLEDIFLLIIHRLIALCRAAGDFDRALDYAHRAVQADPLREDSQRELIRLYLDTGQPAAALQQYRELERVLRTELNATPSPAVRQLI